MKRILNVTYILFSFLLLTFAACSRDDNNVTPGTPGGSSGGGSGSGTPGTGWKVSLFNERGENKTSNYSSYTFEFGADGSMSATGNGQTTTGTWSEYPDDGITKFAINLNTSDANLMELNDDWALVSRSGSLISLQDDNSSSDEQLQFTK